MEKDKLIFINDEGDFQVKDPHKVSYTYFPLCNEKGMKSSVTATLNGDIKIDHNHFALMPVSQEDLHNSKATRNFWIDIDGYGLWSATGNSAKQSVEDKDEVTLEAGFLWKKLVRKNTELGIESTVKIFAPSEIDFVEFAKVTIKNTSSVPLEITPTVAIPLYCRSADNLRDHRHVTALLNRATILDNGIMNKPTLAFDERGHTKNEVSYSVLATDERNNKPKNYYPVLEEFIGDGGSLDWPSTIVEKLDSKYRPGDKIDGYEIIGGLQFEKIKLEQDEEYSYVFLIAIDEKGGSFEDISSKYCSVEAFDKYFTKNKAFWKKKLETLEFNTGDENFNNWIKWVTLQPILRRIYGCSFLPHHDYGRGGRGWRDLWQDCLALILMEPKDVRYLLLNNYGGIRVDGSNATIIGSKPGEFVADRNNIARVWMDHGSWPLLTTKLYVDRSGDIDFLFEKQTYFKDKHINRSKSIDENWDEEYGNIQIDRGNNVYFGTILEHLLVQNLTLFFNVGEHNNILLEDADWNDGLDMASKRGESVAFTAFYGSNLLELANMIQEIKQRRNIEVIEVFEEMAILFDTINNPVKYGSVEEKKALLKTYFDKCRHNIAGKKVSIDIDNIINDLQKKGNWIMEHIRENEWIDSTDGLGWFNGYYDDNSEPLESGDLQNIKMTLTGQVFNIMGGVATQEHIRKIVKAADKHLRDESVGGYRLNNDFKEVKLNMGRLFGFAFGHKENGAMFSHMAVMYSNALYKRNFANEGFKVINGIYNHCMNFDVSKIYPGMPEYIDMKGRGMYHYLTGSASWMILNMVTEVFGVKGYYGDLVLEPKILLEQFDEKGAAKINTLFADKILEISYINSNSKEYGEYSIKGLEINGEEIEPIKKDDQLIIPRSILDALDDIKNEIKVTLG